MYYEFNTNGQTGSPVQSPATPKAAPFATPGTNRNAPSVNTAPIQNPAHPAAQEAPAAPTLTPIHDDSFIEGWDSDFEDGETKQTVNITVFGVGGGGNNAVNRMYLNGENNAKFVVLNTDIPILRSSPVPTKVGIGRNTTRGHGAGANPEVGKAAAEESIELIKSKLDNVDMLYITAGMGGGTGTGASPVIASAARELGILTIAVVTKPFAFEGPARMAAAEDGIAKLRQYVDAVIVVPNEKLNTLSNKPLGVKEAFKAADEILIRGVQSICSLINDESYINLDFADVTTILRNSGEAHIGIGIASGEDKAMKAAEQAINSPLLETSIDDADGMIISVTADENVSINEISDAIKSINERAASNVRIIWGLKFDPGMGDKIEITVIATKSGTIADREQYAAQINGNETVVNQQTQFTQPTANVFAQDNGSNPVAAVKAPQNSAYTPNVAPNGYTAIKDAQVQNTQKPSIIMTDDEFNLIRSIVSQSKGGNN